VDWTKKEDDEIAMVLRQAQRSLRDQIAHNNVRKDRLTELVRDRLAYTGYKKTLEGMEKVIENAWLKRSTRKPKKSKSKDKEELAQSKRIGDKSLLPEAVKLAIDARRRWIDIVGGAMATPEVGTRYTGLPVESVYHGLDALKADVAHRRWSTPTE
jgi:transcriptional adapter 3